MANKVTNDEMYKAILKTKVQLGRNRPFFAYILMSMRVDESPHLPTMGVNQIGDLYYSPEFAQTLSKDELEFVLCHEVLHVALLTFQREGSRDHKVWNYATDLVINWILRDEGLTSYPKKILMADAKTGEWEFEGKGKKKVKIMVQDKSAEEVYGQLIAQVEHLYSYDASGSGDGGEQGMPENGQFDSHIEGDKDDKGDSQKKLGGTADKKANEEYWKGVTTSANITAKQRGLGSSTLERLLDELLNPKIDWRQKLYMFLTKDVPIDFTYSRPHRRSIALGMYLPDVVRENIEVGIFPDVSGSISQEEFSRFMAEACGIIQSFPQMKARVIFWADGVNPHDDLEVTPMTLQTLLTFKVKNSGGTTMGCIKEYLNEVSYRPRVAVFLTDGHIEADPELPENMKLLFVVSSNGSTDILDKANCDVTQLLAEK